MSVTTPLLAGLLKKATIEDHEEILKASSAALKKSRTDVQAQHAHAVALLKQDRYDEALRFIQDCGQPLQERAALEHAFVLYKTGQWEEALKTLEGASGRGAQHLEAQVQYRLENSARVLDIYEEIKKQGLLDEELDIRINVGAVEAQKQWLGEPLSKRAGANDLQQFETAYNAACSSIARGEFAQAEILLKRAHELCKHHDELDDAAKQEELLPIKVQQLYVLQVQGKTEEAAALVEGLLTDQVADQGTRVIAASNKLVGSSTSNPFLVHKAFSATPKPTQGNDSLFSFQSEPFDSNTKTIDLQALKFNGLISSAKGSKRTDLSHQAVLASVFGAAARAENEISKAAIGKVLPDLAQRPTDVGLILTLIQMYVLIGNTTSAIKLLQPLFQRFADPKDSEVEAIRYNPGLVSVLIGLYRSLGQKSSIKAELERSASYWRSQPKAPSSLLRAAGTALLESGDTNDTNAAAEIFTKLREQQPDERAALAGFVASHAVDDAESVEVEAEKLASVADLTQNIDVDALESAGIPQSSNALHIAQLTRSRKRAADGISSQPKRVRKSRLPKDYDPSKTPDPERWLPMKDRSYYRPPKGKKKGKKGGGDTQGGAVNESLNIDAKSGASTPQQSGGGGGGKKKKGKR